MKQIRLLMFYSLLLWSSLSLHADDCYLSDSLVNKREDFLTACAEQKIAEAGRLFDGLGFNYEKQNFYNYVLGHAIALQADGDPNVFEKGFSLQENLFAVVPDSFIFEEVDSD